MVVKLLNGLEQWKHWQRCTCKLPGELIMTINEAKTNIQSVTYTQLPNNTLSISQQKSLFNYFSNCNCAIIEINGKKYEAYLSYRYCDSAINGLYSTYSIFEFTRNRKKEYIIRIVTWDRIESSKSILQKKKQLIKFDSNVIYVPFNESHSLKKMLAKLKSFFMFPLNFKKNDTQYFERELYIGGVTEKCIRWRNPQSNEKLDSFLNHFIECVHEMINLLFPTVDKVNFIFDTSWNLIL